jgi:hypothetical protein
VSVCVRLVRVHTHVCGSPTYAQLTANKGTLQDLVTLYQFASKLPATVESLEAYECVCGWVGDGVGGTALVWLRLCFSEAAL